jgi:hypothetical protein
MGRGANKACCITLAIRLGFFCCREGEGEVGVGVGVRELWVRWGVGGGWRIVVSVEGLSRGPAGCEWSPTPFPSSLDARRDKARPGLQEQPRGVRDRGLGGQQSTRITMS